MPETYGRGKWAQPGVPHRGWTCVGMTDLGSLSETCEMCESQEIRYVHEMSHPDWPVELGVGCVCAENMEAVSTAARKREQALKTRPARRAKWLSRNWQGFLYGVEERTLRAKGWVAHVFPLRGAWSASISYRPTGYRRPASRLYQTRQAAMLATFDAIEGAKEKGLHLKDQGNSLERE